MTQTFHIHEIDEGTVEDFANFEDMSKQDQATFLFLMNDVQKLSISCGKTVFEIRPGETK